MQLDRPERASPYSQDAPWTCGWTPDADLTAADILSTYDRRRLSPTSSAGSAGEVCVRIAGFIVERRAARNAPQPNRPAHSETLYDAIPAPARRTGGHPPSAPSRALHRRQRQAGLP